MIKFSIKIDDDAHSLNKEDGISFDKIGELLKNLFDAIDTGTGQKCTLGQVRGNCYALDFYTEDEGKHNNFVVVHKNIEKIDLDELSKEQKKYAITLRSILGDKYYLKAYDKENNEIADIVNIDAKNLANYYFTTETVYGIPAEIGSGANLNSNQKHIYLDGIGYRIYISKEQNLQLKEFYSTQKLRVELRQKRSSENGRIISSELESFVPVSGFNLSESISNAGYIDFELIKNTNSIEDILNRIYANR